MLSVPTSVQIIPNKIAIASYIPTSVSNVDTHTEQLNLIITATCHVHAVMHNYVGISRSI